MVIKESSDELNPTVLTADSAVPATRPVRSVKDYVALAIATCGVGYLPLAPGTWGSLVGIAVYVVLWWPTRTLAFRLIDPERHGDFQIYYGVLVIELIVALLLALLGTWAASRTEKLSGKKDPSKVVIDEVAGQFITLLSISLLSNPPSWTLVAAFVLFRFFDIVKPYPARRLENLQGGLGVMADDVIAGVYAAIGVMIAVCASWLI